MLGIGNWDAILRSLSSQHIEILTARYLRHSDLRLTYKMAGEKEVGSRGFMDRIKDKLDMDKIKETLDKTHIHLTHKKSASPLSGCSACI